MSSTDQKHSVSTDALGGGQPIKAATPKQPRIVLKPPSPKPSPTPPPDIKDQKEVKVVKEPVKVAEVTITSTTPKSPKPDPKDPKEPKESKAPKAPKVRCTWFLPKANRQCEQNSKSNSEFCSRHHADNIKKLEREAIERANPKPAKPSPTAQPQQSEPEPEVPLPSMPATAIVAPPQQVIKDDSQTEYIELPILASDGKDSNLDLELPTADAEEAEEAEGPEGETDAKGDQEPEGGEEEFDTDELLIQQAYSGPLADALNKYLPLKNRKGMSAKRWLILMNAAKKDFMADNFMRRGTLFIATAVEFGFNTFLSSKTGCHMMGFPQMLDSPDLTETFELLRDDPAVKAVTANANPWCNLLFIVVAAALASKREGKPPAMDFSQRIPQYKTSTSASGGT